MFEFSNSRREPRWRRWVFPACLASATAYVVVSLADWITFQPSVYPTGAWTLADSLGAADVAFASADGVDLHAWYATASTDQALARTVFLHGNAGNLTHRASHIEAITRAGSDVLIVDYRGYGKSLGSPSEQGVYLDAVAAYDWLTARRGDELPIICHGESLGTAVAVDLATRRRCDGLILEAPFPSRSAVAGRLVPFVGPLLARGFQTAEKLSLISSPLLLIHGEADAVIPFPLGQQVFDAAREPKELWALPAAGHNNIVAVAGSEYWRRLSSFYKQLDQTRPH